MTYSAKQIKIGIIVVAFSSALVVTVLQCDGETTVADTDDSKTLWRCAACGHDFALTARQAVRAQRKSGGVPIRCPPCREIQAYQLTACLRCGTMMFGSEVPGATGRCPKCPAATQPWADDPAEAATTQPAGRGETGGPDKKPESPEKEKGKKKKVPKSL